MKKNNSSEENYNTAGIQNEKSGVWIHKQSAFHIFFCLILMIGYIIRRGKFANLKEKKSFVFLLGTQKNRLNETFLLRI